MKNSSKKRQMDTLRNKPTTLIHKPRMLYILTKLLKPKCTPQVQSTICKRPCRNSLHMQITKLPLPHV
ncbi:hypothetical protein EUTSA_v10019412mg [Eutrema salsugineum]|uniref:Uncharacterized protein n=1 Tax=Eutrema salsugineum TaxID=72664 RepID=V4M9R5_EUTSA|nr:hypothetical protein EUTSA_v10019412mg [Eutrema salsugineum]